MQALKRWFRRQSNWLESQQASILSAAFIILSANLVTAIFGLVKSRVISATYLAEPYHSLVDAYWVALRLPEFLFQLLIMGTLSAAFVPVFTQLYKSGSDKAYELMRQLMFLLLTTFTITGVVTFIFAPQLVQFYTGPEFNPEQIELAISMTRIMLITQLLFAISGFFSAMLQSLKRFILPAFSPVFYNIGIILFIVFLTDKLGLYAAAWGTVFGAFLHMAIQIPLVWKCGFRPFGSWNWRWSQLKRVLGLAGPRTITMVTQQATVLAITFLATTVGGISLTLITFAQQLMTLPIRFFGVSIGQAALPFLSASQDDLSGFRQMVFRSLRQIAFFAAPAAALLLVLRVALVRLAFGVAEFPWSATIITAEALGILALSIPAQAFTHLLVRSFYALNNAVVPFIGSLLYFVVTALVGFVLVTNYQLGVAGLAWGLTIASIIEMLVLLGWLMRRMGSEGVWTLIWALVRISGAAFLMALTLFVFQRLFDWYVFETSRVWQLIQLTLIVGSMGSMVYLGLCWLLQIEELTILKRMGKRLRSQWDKIVKTTPDFVESVSQPEDF